MYCISSYLLCRPGEYTCKGSEGATRKLSEGAIKGGAITKGRVESAMEWYDPKQNVLNGALGFFYQPGDPGKLSIGSWGPYSDPD